MAAAAARLAEISLAYKQNFDIHFKNKHGASTTEFGFPIPAIDGYEYYSNRT